ncbi:MAG: FprA family A-type flavoprotein [Peptococcaceae bacterium]|jgi:flavorubredoxin|nr:FprA family A-type flavoprotein [Peptococcaceae bacterium]MBQ5858422.1 FprA family A-type flavoprotein [Peptococcaceae bacterium]
MHNTRKIQEDLIYVGANDRRLALFENHYPIPRGVSYNAYVVLDEKTVLLDTADAAVSDQFFDNVEYALGGRPLDYIIVNHMEPDHCASLGRLLEVYPEATIICNSKTLTMIHQFFRNNVEDRVMIIKEGDTFSSGRHVFTFVMAPMVHWPEAMVTYDVTDKILFSADAFGTWGALNGNLFNDDVNFERDWLDDARRYYTNIVGKYGPQVQALLGKAAGLEINMICPLHGPVIRSDFGFFLDKYQKWSTYEPEEKAVMIAYGSIYGGTAAAADILANKLAERGVKNITVYDTSATHSSYILADAFRCSHLVFASATYNNNIFSTMEHLLHELKAHNLSNRTVALIQNGTWGPNAGKQMRELLEGMKNMNILDGMVTIKSRLAEGQMSELDALADAIVASMQA